MKNKSHIICSDYFGNHLIVGDIVGCAVSGLSMPYSPTYEWEVASYHSDSRFVFVRVPGYMSTCPVAAECLIKMEK